MTNNPNWNYNPNDEGAIAIPVRISNDAPPAEPTYAPASDEDVVRDYEARYFGVNQDMPQKSKREDMREQVRGRMSNFTIPPRHRYANRPSPVAMNGSDRTWATIAHGSSILTLLAILGGPPVFLTLLVPLAIYFIARNRSEYVAFHALQAFTFQTVATIGTMIALAIFGLTMVISAITIIGLPIFFVMLLMLPFVLGAAALTVFVALPVYSLSAAFATWDDRSYRYPWVADWVDDQLTNGMFGPATTV